MESESKVQKNDQEEEKCLDEKKEGFLNAFKLFQFLGVIRSLFNSYLDDFLGTLIN